MANHLLQKLLLVVDRSQSSWIASEYAVRLAEQSHSHVLALFVVDLGALECVPEIQTRSNSEKTFEKQIIAQGTQYLKRLETLAKAKRVPFETLVLHGEFHVKVLETVEKQHPNLVVLGGWERTVLKKDYSTLQRQLIADIIDCPVLIVR